MEAEHQPIVRRERLGADANQSFGTLQASPFPGFYWAGTGDEHLGARWHKPNVRCCGKSEAQGCDALGAR